MSPSKMTTSQGTKRDSGKLRYSLNPPLAARERAAVLTYGATLYGAGNWRTLDAAPERYLDAAIRHIECYRLGHKLDEDSNLFVLAHTSCCLDFITELELEHRGKEDDFPARYRNALAKAAELRAERSPSESTALIMADGRRVGIV